MSNGSGSCQYMSNGSGSCQYMSNGSGSCQYMSNGLGSCQYMSNQVVVSTCLMDQETNTTWRGEVLDMWQDGPLRIRLQNKWSKICFCTKSSEDELSSRCIRHRKRLRARRTEQ